MSLPQYTMRELMEAGVHFGHKTKRWNPKMAPFLFGIRNDVHIIDLQQTVPMLDRALKAVQDIVARNGRVLFVGTKRQAQEVVSEQAKRCGQYYVNHRWLGGMLTNWKTISGSIKKLKDYEEKLNNPESGLTKKERLKLEAHKEKLDRALGGIRDMGGQPDLIFVIDTNKESIAIQEATKLGIPVVAVLDSNCNPDHITFPVPGNDDSTRAIRTYCRLISEAVLSGIEAEVRKSGVDVGESAEVPAALTGADKAGKKADKADAKASQKKETKADSKESASKESLDKLVKEKSSEGDAAKADDAKKEEKAAKAKKPAAKKAPAKKAEPKKAEAKKDADTPAKKAASS